MLNTVKALVLNVFMPTVILSMCQTEVKFYLDTGAEVNVMDEKHYKKLVIRPKLQRCNKALYGYSNHEPVPISTIGEFNTRVLYGQHYHSITFVVTSGNGGNLLSYESAVKLGVMSRIKTVTNNKQYEKWMQKYPNLFIGKVGLLKNFEAKLHIDPSVHPRREKLRHIPFHLRDQVALEIKDMLEQDLIEPVVGPTP